MKQFLSAMYILYILSNQREQNYVVDKGREAGTTWQERSVDRRGIRTKNSNVPGSKVVHGSPGGQGAWERGECSKYPKQRAEAESEDLGRINHREREDKRQEWMRWEDAVDHPRRGKEEVKKENINSSDDETTKRHERRHRQTEREMERRQQER